MALEHALGQDLSQNDSTTGKPGCITSVGEQKGDTYGYTVIVRGPLGALAGLVPAKGADHTACGWVPDGLYVDTATLKSSNGEATITLKCVDPGGDTQQNPAAPTLIEYQILMSEVQMDLIAHPDITSSQTALDECIKWQATPEQNRRGSAGGQMGYQYLDENGDYQPVSQPAAEKFCYAWERGIHSYNRYYPVIEKKSYYRRVPGLTLVGLKGQSPTGTIDQFSTAIGTFDEPDISLSGYASAGFFKSGDDYRSSGKGFMRSEQWTWTPDYDDENLTWIYGGHSSSGNSNGGNGGSSK
jgi:hypothetical protein